MAVAGRRGLAFGVGGASIKRCDSAREAMAVDYIRYDILTQEAMRGVMRTVLRDAAARGLPGEHHFFISFDTRDPGVKLSARLRAQYPEEMTIVLQHQFWDLTVDEEAFEVGLSFNGTPERLTIPFAAVKGFADLSVKFGVRFTTAGEDSEPADAIVGPATTTPAPPPAPEQTPGTAGAALPKPATPEQAPEGTDKPPGAEVVRLDRFRKK